MSILYASDLISQYIPWYYITAKYLHSFSLTHWVPNVYGMGYPLLAEGETGILSPINSFILFLFPLPLAVNFLYLTYFFIAFYGTYLFSQQNKISSLSSILAGLIFSLSGFMVTRYFQPSIIFTAAFIPFGFAIIQKAQNNQKILFLLAPLIYLQVTAGHLQIALISIAAYAVFTTLLSAFTKNWKTFLTKTILIIALGIILSSVQIIPSYKLFKLSVRQSFDPMIRFSYSLPPSHLITYIFPAAYGISKPGDDAGFTQFGGGFWELNITIWTIPFILSIIPAVLLTKRRSKIILILYSLWILFTLISFGGFFKPNWIIAHIPNFPFRAPARFMIISTFAASILATIGFEQITSKMKNQIKYAAFAIIIGSIIFQQSTLLNQYVITKPSIEIESKLKNLTRYQMTTPLKLKEDLKTEKMPTVFKKQFQNGLLLSIIAAFTIYLWYRKSEKTK